jgi:CO/xanthine dehydrogenase Mo-binding subunit
VTPSPWTWNGVKGVGEGGRMAAPAAIVSAIEDALAPFDVTIDTLPVTPAGLTKLLAARRKMGQPVP